MKQSHMPGHGAKGPSRPAASRTPKVIVLTLLLTLLAALGPMEAKSLRFYYLAHDESTPTTRLYEQLRRDYRDALELGEDFIFYLPNGSQPIIVQVNTPDDNRADFDHLASELLNKTQLMVSPADDVPLIIDLISRIGLTDADGALRYESARLNFYVTSAFWQLGYNESILAALYFALDVPRLEELGVEYNIYRSQEDNIAYDAERPLGPVHFGRDDATFMMLEY